MKNELEKIYNDLLEKYKTNNPAKLLIYSKEEYLNSNELKEEIRLSPNDKEELIDMPNYTFGYYSTQSNIIYIFDDYYDNTEGSFKNISKELLYTFTLVHEYRHVMQRNDKDSFIYSIRKMELMVNKNYNDETHDYFYHEIDSNLFAAQYLKSIKNNYSGIDYDYINLLNYVYQYDLCGYDFDILINNYIKLSNENEFKSFFFNNDKYKRIEEIIINKNNINRDLLNIVVTSEEFIKYQLKNNLNKKEKSFLNKEIKYRIRKIEDIKLIDIDSINELFNKINIKKNKDFNIVINYRNRLLKRLKETNKLLED